MRKKTGDKKGAGLRGVPKGAAEQRRREDGRGVDEPHSSGIRQAIKTIGGNADRTTGGATGIFNCRLTIRDDAPTAQGKDMRMRTSHAPSGNPSVEEDDNP
jgi:hypothetical protein